MIGLLKGILVNLVVGRFVYYEIFRRTENRHPKGDPELLYLSGNIAVYCLIAALLGGVDLERQTMRWQEFCLLIWVMSTFFMAANIWAAPVMLWERIYGLYILCKEGTDFGSHLRIIKEKEEDFDNRCSKVTKKLWWMGMRPPPIIEDEDRLQYWINYLEEEEERG